jgi:hypothetical protein
MRTCFYDQQDRGNPRWQGTERNLSHPLSPLPGFLIAPALIGIDHPPIFLSLVTSGNSNFQKKGGIWRVGNGNNIIIWEDRWVPRSYSCKVLTLKGKHIYTKVSDLIDPITNSWDEELIIEIFWSVDKHIILAIPLPSHDLEDFVGWSLTKSGTFSVRTAYHAEWESRFGPRVNGGAAPSAMNPHPMWDKIWKLKCPSKVEIFLWRFMQETIPCQVVLVNKHVKVSAQYPLCEIDVEDTKHMLFNCGRAKEI